MVYEVAIPTLLTFVCDRRSPVVALFTISTSLLRRSLVAQKIFGSRTAPGGTAEELATMADFDVSSLVIYEDAIWVHILSQKGQNVLDKSKNSPK